MNKKVGRPPLPPSPDPAVMAKRAQGAAARARRRARKRGLVVPDPPRVVGSVAFEAVTCPRCGALFTGRYPLKALGAHRQLRWACAWDVGERAQHDADMRRRANTLTVERLMLLYEPAAHTPRRCEGCGDTFTPKTSRSLTCSHRCSHRRTLARMAGRILVLPTAGPGQQGPLILPDLQRSHRLFDRARELLLRGHPGWLDEDELGEAVLALLERRDPLEAARQVRRTADRLRWMRSLDAPLRADSTLTLLDVIGSDLCA